MLELHAPAKINLFLRVLARERSGYHRIETLFCTLEFGDTVRLEPTDSGVSLQVEGPGVGPEKDNLVYRAIQAFMEESGAQGGVHAHLIKRVPPGAGLGGGSSDAAATLRGLQDLIPGAVDDARLLDLAAALGSDVPAFLSPSSLTLAWGRGERLLPLPPLPSVPVVLALPPITISTPEAYALLAGEREGRPDGPEPRLVALETLSGWPTLEPMAVNDFEGPIFRQHELLGVLREGLKETGARPSLLSGSGAALFGVYPDPERARTAAAVLGRRFPEVRFVLTRTRGSQEAPGG